MLLQILELIVCGFLALFLVMGIISLSMLVFYCKNQQNCQSLILLTDKDTNADFVIRACLRADRLLGRTRPPIVIDAGLSAEGREIVRRTVLRYDLTMIARQTHDDAECNQKNV